jgi:hypothetical protein
LLSANATSLSVLGDLSIKFNMQMMTEVNLTLLASDYYPFRKEGRQLGARNKSNENLINMYVAPFGDW